MDNAADPRLVLLYQRAQLCRLFPAYKLEDLKDASRELLWAAELLSLARQATESGG